MLSRGQQNAVLGKIVSSPQNHLPGCEQARARVLLGKKKDVRRRRGK